jgi:SAM-dependent methyltransferase
MLSSLQRRLPAKARFTIRELVLLGRGMAHRGTRTRCPCCGWRLRSFVDKWSLLSTTIDGYCPRCNSKARHRRLWLFLERELAVSTTPRRVLDVGPWSSIGRAFRPLGSVTYIGLDLVRLHRHVDVMGDITSAPLGDGLFDLVLCNHVLEHIEDDRAAMAELHRVVRPGGLAVVSVPLLDDGPTFEDPSISSPEDRKRYFGERGHVRFYGLDLRDRLEAAGFRVEFRPGSAVEAGDVADYGLRTDESLFLCRRPEAGEGDRDRRAGT